MVVKKRDNTKEERSSRNINTSNEIVYLNNVIQNGTNKLNAEDLMSIFHSR